MTKIYQKNKSTLEVSDMNDIEPQVGVLPQINKPAPYFEAKKQLAA